jgi:tetratricopeptide (TPR) repeat protein/transcriptional regulator with XRE-family HTH domain
VEQISAELDARAVTARQLRAEAEQAEALASLYREAQAELLAGEAITGMIGHVGDMLESDDFASVLMPEFPMGVSVPVPSRPAKDFGRLLREIRESQGLTIENLAAASGVSVTTISTQERGLVSRPQRAIVRKLAGALDLSGDELADFEAASRRGRAHSISTPERNTADSEDAAVRPASVVAAAQGMATRALPYPIRSFTGRDEELSELVGALSDADRSRIHVIRGMPGAGKTALAVQVGHRVAGGFPDGQFFIDLQGHTRGLKPLRPDEALRSVLHNCLGTPNEVIPRKLNDRAALYRSRLAGTRTLIVLDSAADSAQVRPLLPGDRGCAVIVTSREYLRGLDDAAPLSLGTLPDDKAIDLLCTAAGPPRLSADDPDLSRIVQLCGGLPLAIRITAAFMRDRPLLTAGDVLELLSDERERLALQSEDVSVRAAFDLSYWRLPEAEQRMFRRLGLIPGLDFDAHAATSLVGGDARRLLESLVDHHLLIQHARQRYRLHDLVRVYARSLARHEDAEVSARLLDFYLASAQAADAHLERRSPGPHDARPVSTPVSSPQLQTSAQARDWVRTELANLDAAAQHAAAAGQRDFTISLSMALAQYLRAYGPWNEGLLLHRLAGVMARETDDSEGQAAALVHVGVLHRQLGQLPSAKVALNQAARLYRGLGNDQGLAAALLESGVVKRLTDMPEEGGRELSDALALYRALGDRHGEAGALAELGALQRQTSEFEAAIDNLQEALGLFRDLGMRYGEAVTLGYLGTVQRTTGVTEEARKSLDAALYLYRERREPIGQANILLFLGDIYKDLGQLDQAVSVLEEAKSLYGAAGYQRGVAGALTFLGEVQQLNGDSAAADVSISRALEIFSEVDDPGGEVEALNKHAHLGLARRAPDEALVRYEQALELARRIKSRKDEADALEGIARVHLFSSHVPKARAYYRQALAAYKLMRLEKDAERVRLALSKIGEAS